MSRDSAMGQALVVDNRAVNLSHDAPPRILRLAMMLRMSVRRLAGL